MTDTDRAALEAVLAAPRVDALLAAGRWGPESLRPRWAEWLIFADYLDETPGAFITGRPVRAGSWPQGGRPKRGMVTTRGALAAAVREAVRTEQKAAAAQEETSRVWAAREGRRLARLAVGVWITGWGGWSWEI